MRFWSRKEMRESAGWTGRKCQKRMSFQHNVNQYESLNSKCQIKKSQLFLYQIRNFLLITRKPLPPHSSNNKNNMDYSLIIVIKDGLHGCLYKEQTHNSSQLSMISYIM
jgi:hypothetical protein